QYSSSLSIFLQIKVDQQVISGNQDFPEGGFDGFLQSIVCKKMIGWREISRKLLLYLSDAGFHFAGDGLLGGVVLPHDGQCHMEDLQPDRLTGNIVYQHWNRLDYPSIGQIAEKLFEFDVIPIFAVVESIQHIYNPLVDELGRDRAYLGTLAADSSNIVDLVEEIYYRISQRIVFAPEIVPGLSIKVTLTECPGRVPVRAIGFGTFQIQVDAKCNCSCENKEEENSTSCSNHGDLVCGICECYYGFFGESASAIPPVWTTRECSSRAPMGYRVWSAQREDRVPVASVNVAKDAMFSGKACECDSSICESGGTFCSGPSQGECTCDGCRCLIEPTTGIPYNGTYCECSPNTQTCRDHSNSTDLCNGRGWCSCGQCSCFPPFFGTYCELCSGSNVCIQGTCDISGPNGICTGCAVGFLEVFHANNVTVDELLSEAFVQIAIRNGTLPLGTVLGELNGEKAIFLPETFSAQCNRSCTPLVIINQTLNLEYDIQGFLSTRCQYNRLACDYRYYVALNTTDGTKLPIHIEYPPYCPTRASSKRGSGLAIPPWAIALILILLLLLLGLLALALLKLLLMLLDWIEVRRFEKELGKTKYTKSLGGDGRRCNAIDRDNPTTNTCSMPLEDPVSELINKVDVVLEGLRQVTPERVNVSVRQGSPVTFEVQVKPANNFPIDLYLLMDLSASMSDDLENLKTLGRQLANRIASISNNFTVGFGSFVDKRRGSFVNLDPNRLQDPCNGGCEPPYSFRHVVRLTRDGELFSDTVEEQIISGNQDFPEGGFDGFMQAIVCTNLGGVIEPNDGMCHMGPMESTTNSDGTIEYNAWDRLDFPSIGQIAEKLDEFDIIPILAVVERFQELYALLQAELGNRAFLGELDTDSSNVVDLVEDLYNEISTSVAFSPVNVPGVSITTTITNCPAPRVGVCTNVMSSQTVTFNVTVDVTECTEELLAGPREIQLRVLGFGSVTVDLNAVCDCNCDAQRETNSSECNGRGTLVCALHRAHDDDNDCMNSVCRLGLGGLQCSGRGTCTCGICECRRDSNGDERFYGPACECDNTVCERGTGNEICSGPSNGECTCDGCRCLPEPFTGLPYTMSDCSCTPNIQTCVDPANSTDLCNGRGVCQCGECICNPNSPYFGDLCEECSTGSEVCRLQTCAVDSDNTLCASCVIDLLEQLNILGVNESIFTEEGFAKALRNATLPEDSNLTMVVYGDEMLKVAAILLPPEFTAECSGSVNVTCPRFYIVNETQEMEYEIQNVLSQRCTLQQDCIYPYYVSIDRLGNLLPIHVGYPPGILLLLGILALILLKILLMVLDYIELKKFENELEKVKYSKNENPLYHSATTEHKNPIYGQ
ncbi:Integrin beta-1, partial [Geodia barretti]